MKYRLLVRTGLFVSEVSSGTMNYGGKGRWATIGKLGLSDAQSQIKTAFDAGVNFIDTANVYSEGESENLVGEALAKLGLPRDELGIATRVRVRMGPGPNSVGLSRKQDEEGYRVFYKGAWAVQPEQKSQPIGDARWPASIENLIPKSPS